MDITIDLSKTHIETSRVILRCFQPDDLYDFFCYAKVKGVGEAAGWNHHETLEESERILNKFCEEKKVLALECKETGRVIGSIGLHKSFANDLKDYCDLTLKEVGFVLAKDYWGRGIMTETLKVFIKYIFDNFPVQAITASCFLDNPASERVILKCGFKFVCEIDHFAKQLNKTIPTKSFILLKEKFNGNTHT